MKSKYSVVTLPWTHEQQTLDFSLFPAQKLRMPVTITCGFVIKVLERER